jgi:flagellar biosynthesis chaperone FliJ
MLIRISLIVAVIAGLAVGGLNFIMVKDKVTTLISQRDTEHDGRVRAETELATTKNNLEITTAKLKQTEETLALTSTERDNAVAEADKQTKRAAELTQALQKTTQERDDAQANLASYTASGLTAPQVVGLAKQMKNLEDSLEVSKQENKILQEKLVKTENELARYTIKDWHGPPLPPTLMGKIAVFDPKFDFVVLNIGKDQGLVEYGELLVSRNGTLLGRVRVRTVEKDRSIANLVPGWSLGQIMEGDVVTPANPAS